ncbi:hypothetical protein EP342_00525 [bacterium]|nr:MAG: hypothetical protein EP342_00525 [bacterium]
MNPFKGTYELLEKYSIRVDGSKIHPWGNDVKGMIIYTDSHISAQLGINNRENFRDFNFRNATEREAQEAFTTYIAYFGTYEVKDGYIIHDIKQSLFPNWIGHKVKRYYRFEGDLLYLEAKEIAQTTRLEKTVLVWRRLS